jgi:predicted ATP-dependent endonuclease of OLD family
MKIKKIYIENFRILENFTIDLEDEISLIIGKNNSGKTSILTILDKFLNQPDSNRFNVEDFNLNFVAVLTAVNRQQKVY